MKEPIAYNSGEFIPMREFSISPQDTGFMLGITVAEQLRTFDGKLFGWHEHLARLARGLDIISLDDQIDLVDLKSAVDEVMHHNHDLLNDGDDLGVTVFVTPGIYSAHEPGRISPPTVGIHTHPLPFSLWADKYEVGQRCVVSSVRQVDQSNWPRELKCRSRAHYYLAQQQVRQLDSKACPILIDMRGEVNEAPTANVIAYYADEGLVSPTLEGILPGVSLRYVEKLAKQMGLRFTYRSLQVDELLAADEVMLTSTPYCVLPVSAVDDRTLGFSTVVGRLLATWSKDVDVDIVAQARRFSSRRPH